MLGDTRGHVSDRRAQLEATLREQWSLDELAVYADELLGEGDPHGELIAIDLAEERTADRLVRRRALLAAWIGKKLAAAAGDRIHLGFIDSLAGHTLAGGEDELYAQLLASPAGKCVRRFHIRGSVAVVRAALKRLSWQPRPWLGKLEIEVTGSESFAGGKLVDDVVRATPWLDELAISGRRVLLGFPHPRLRKLRVSGCDAIGSLGGASRDVLPAVTHLDLAMCAEAGDIQTGRRVAALVLEQLPALTHLDLSRNEPGNRGPVHLGADADVFALLRDASVRARLTHLKLPALRTRASIETLLEAMAGMPALVAVEIARTHRASALPFELARHRVPVTLLRALPWPDVDDRDDILTISYPRSYNHTTLSLDPLYQALDASWSDYSIAARVAWLELLGALDDLHWLDARGLPVLREFPAATLEHALESVRDVPAWSSFHHRLRGSQEPTVLLSFTHASQDH